jgi:hypothetical protein
MLKRNKAKILILIFTIFLLLLLDKCSLNNIFTSNIFKNPKYKHYQFLNKYIKCGNIEVLRLSYTKQNIVEYDTIDNYFLVQGDSVYKIDINGNINFKLSWDSVKLLPSSHYVCSKSGIYDLSKEVIHEEKFSEIINSDTSLSVKSWLELFDKYYRKAQIVIFDFDYSFDDAAIFLQIAGKWILFIYKNETNLQSENEFVNSNGRKAYFLKGYPDKLNRMILLKDEIKNTYSTFWYLSESFSHDWELRGKLIYPRNYNIKISSFNKDTIFTEAAYTQFSINWLGTAYYSLHKNEDVLNFKYFAIKEVGFFGTVEQDFYWFHLPMKFSQKSSVSFITFYSVYDKNDPKYLGLFMIRKLP